MKHLLLILAAAFNFSAFGQTGSAVTIIAHKWRVTREAPRADMSIPNQAVDQQQQDWLLQAKINEDRAKRGLPPIPPPTAPIPTSPRTTSKRVAGSNRNIYVYEAKVKNTGSKTVSSITWEYIFYTPDKTRELGRLKFTSTKEIGPGREKKLVIRTAYPPTRIISAASANSKPADQYAEAAIIKRVEYTDGSVD